MNSETIKTVMLAMMALAALGGLLAGGIAGEIDNRRLCRRHRRQCGEEDRRHDIEDAVADARGRPRRPRFPHNVLRIR